MIRAVSVLINAAWTYPRGANHHHYHHHETAVPYQYKYNTNTKELYCPYLSKNMDIRLLPVHSVPSL